MWAWVVKTYQQLDHDTHYCSLLFTYAHTAVTNLLTRHPTVHTCTHRHKNTHTHVHLCVKWVHAHMHTRTKCLYSIHTDVDFALLTYLLLTYLLGNRTSREGWNVQEIVIVQLTYLLTYSLGIRTSRITGTRYSLSYLLTWKQGPMFILDSLESA